MQSALQPLTGNIDCEQCHLALGDRVKDVVVQWASVGVSAVNFLILSTRTVLQNRNG